MAPPTSPSPARQRSRSLSSRIRQSFVLPKHKFIPDVDRELTPMWEPEPSPPPQPLAPVVVQEPPVPRGPRLSAVELRRQMAMDGSFVPVLESPSFSRIDFYTANALPTPSPSSSHLTRRSFTHSQTPIIFPTSMPTTLSRTPSLNRSKSRRKSIHHHPGSPAPFLRPIPTFEPLAFPIPTPTPAKSDASAEIRRKRALSLPALEKGSARADWLDRPFDLPLPRRVGGEGGSLGKRMTISAPRAIDPERNERENRNKTLRGEQVEVGVEREKGDDRPEFFARGELGRNRLSQGVYTKLVVEEKMEEKEKRRAARREGGQQVDKETLGMLLGNPPVPPIPFPIQQSTLSPSRFPRPPLRTDSLSYQPPPLPSPRPTRLRSQSCAPTPSSRSTLILTSDSVTQQRFRRKSGLLSPVDHLPPTPMLPPLGTGEFEMGFVVPGELEEGELEERRRRRRSSVGARGGWNSPVVKERLRVGGREEAMMKIGASFIAGGRNRSRTETTSPAPSSGRLTPVPGPSKTGPATSPTSPRSRRDPSATLPYLESESHRSAYLDAIRPSIDLRRPGESIPTRGVEHQQNRRSQSAPGAQLQPRTTEATISTGTDAGAQQPVYEKRATEIEPAEDGLGSYSSGRSIKSGRWESVRLDGGVRKGSIATIGSSSNYSTDASTAMHSFGSTGSSLASPQSLHVESLEAPLDVNPSRKSWTPWAEYYERSLGHPIDLDLPDLPFNGKDTLANRRHKDLPALQITDYEPLEVQRTPKIIKSTSGLLFLQHDPTDPASSPPSWSPTADTTPKLRALRRSASQKLSSLFGNKSPKRSPSSHSNKGISSAGFFTPSPKSATGKMFGGGEFALLDSRPAQEPSLLPDPAVAMPAEQTEPVVPNARVLQWSRGVGEHRDTMRLEELFTRHVQEEQERLVQAKDRMLNSPNSSPRI